MKYDSSRLDPASCIHYYTTQQTGGDIPYFYRSQIGHGIFGSIFRSVTPILKRAGLYLGKKLLKTGAKVATDIASGDNLKSSLRKRVREGGEEMRDDVVKKLQEGFGKSIKRRRRLRKRQIHRDIFQA
jgi:hypothetical protein